MVMTARAIGYDALGIADANSMAGVVRLHSEAKTLKLKPVIGWDRNGRRTGIPRLSDRPRRVRAPMPADIGRAG